MFYEMKTFAMLLIDAPQTGTNTQDAPAENSILIFL